MGYAQIDHPLPREEPPKRFDPAWRQDGLVTVCKFGARGNGLHDETACFVAYNDWFRRQLSEPNPQRVWTIGRQGYYWLTETLDWTNYEGVIFDCGSSAIKSKVKNAPVIDARGTSNSTIKYVCIESFDYPNQITLAGIYTGGFRKNQDVIDFYINNLSFDGNYEIAPIVNFGTGSVFNSKISKYVFNHIYDCGIKCDQESSELLENKIQEPIIDLSGVIGGIANKMISLMVALSIQSRVPNCQISNFELKEWNINFPIIAIPATFSAGSSIKISGKQKMKVNIELLSDEMRRGTLKIIYLWCYGQYFSNFKEVEYYRQFFQSLSLKAPIFDDKYVVISIRGDEILKAVHNDYTLIPIVFYEDIIIELGKIPVFVGQIEPNLYIDQLKARFPSALYIKSGGPMYDFEILRSAHNLVVSVSTFSWLAAWLSYAKIIVIPLSGFYNPAQCPHTDLLPLDDSRYRFYQFPINYAVHVDQHIEMHESMTGRWRRITADEIRDIRRNRPIIKPIKDNFLQLFNEDFYQNFYPDIKAAVMKGDLRSGYDHFVTHGFSEGRYPCQFDPVRYGIEHPDAASLVSDGVYLDLLHHFVAVNVHPESL